MRYLQNYTMGTSSVFSEYNYVCLIWKSCTDVTLNILSYIRNIVDASCISVYIYKTEG